MSASSARRDAPAAPRTRGRRAGMLTVGLAVAVGLGVLASVVLLGAGAAWAHPGGMALALASGVATATHAAQTPTVAPTPTIAPTPVTLTSNGLAIFTTLGCIIGVIGLLAFGIAWITLLSDGWGPMIRALIVGNRRGRMRFARKANNSRGRTPDAWDRRRASARDRDGWR